MAKIFLKLSNEKCSPVFHLKCLGWGVPLKACDPWITFNPSSRVGSKNPKILPNQAINQTLKNNNIPVVHTTNQFFTELMMPFSITQQSLISTCYLRQLEYPTLHRGTYKYRQNWPYHSPQSTTFLWLAWSSLKSHPSPSPNPGSGGRGGWCREDLSPLCPPQAAV